MGRSVFLALVCLYSVAGNAIADDVRLHVGQPEAIVRTEHGGKSKPTSFVVFWDMNDRSNNFGPARGEAKRICSDAGNPFGVADSQFLEVSKETMGDLKLKEITQADVNGVAAFKDSVKYAVNQTDESQESDLNILVNSHGQKFGLWSFGKTTWYQGVFESLFGSVENKAAIPLQRNLVVNIFLDACHSETAREVLEEVLAKLPPNLEGAKYRVNLVTTALADGVCNKDKFWKALDATAKVKKCTECSTKTRFNEKDFALLCSLEHSGDKRWNHHKVWSNYQKLSETMSADDVFNKRLNILESHRGPFEEFQQTYQLAGSGGPVAETEAPKVTKILSAILKNDDGKTRERYLQWFKENHYALANRAIVKNLIEIEDSDRRSQLLSALLGYDYRYAGRYLSLSALEPGDLDSLVEFLTSNYATASKSDKDKIASILGKIENLPKRFHGWVREHMDSEKEKNDWLRRALTRAYLNGEKNQTAAWDLVFKDPSLQVRRSAMTLLLEDSTYVRRLSIEEGGLEKMLAWYVASRDGELLEFYKTVQWFRGTYAWKKPYEFPDELRKRVLSTLHKNPDFEKYLSEKYEEDRLAREQIDEIRKDGSKYKDGTQ